MNLPKARTHLRPQSCWQKQSRGIQLELGGVPCLSARLVLETDNLLKLAVYYSEPDLEWHHA